MSASDFFYWTAGAFMWVCFIIPVVGIVLATAFFAISNAVTRRRLERKAKPMNPLPADVIEMRRPASTVPKMIMIQDPGESA